MSPIVTSCVETFCSLIDWNNPAIINKMYKVYLGDIPLKTKEVGCFGLFSRHHEKPFVDMCSVYLNIFPSYFDLSCTHAIGNTGCKPWLSRWIKIAWQFNLPDLVFSVQVLK